MIPISKRLKCPYCGRTKTKSMKLFDEAGLKSHIKIRHMHRVNSLHARVVRRKRRNR